MAKPDLDVTRAASRMGLGTLLSRILGLVREQAFAVLFGASHATDAFAIAFRIPNLLRDLFAEGALSAALVPTFIGVREKEGDRRAWRVAGLVLRVLGVTVATLAVLGIFFAPALVAVYASAYQAVPGKFELTVSLTREMMPFFPLVALAAALMGILNACGVFFRPAFASALFNLVSVGVGVPLTFLMPHWERQPIEGMAWGVLAGGLAQFLYQVPAVREQGYRFLPREASDPVWHRDPALKKMLFLMLPACVGLAATQVNILVNSVLATSQGEGAVTWLNYAFRLMQFPIGVFGVSLAAATLPLVSRAWARGDAQETSNQLVRSLRLVFAINLPATVGLIFAGVPIISMIFEYGRFDANDTLATSRAVSAYALGLVFYSVVKVLVPACYSMGETRAAVHSSILSVGANLLLNFALIGPFGFWGLALGTSITALLNALYLLLVVKRRLKQAGGTLDIANLCDGFGRAFLLSCAMGLVVWILNQGILLLGWSGNSSLLMRVMFRGSAVTVLVLGAVGTGLVFAKILKLKEVLHFAQQMMERIRKVL